MAPMRARDHYQLHTSPGSRFIFFSWIFHELYIKPRSANSFRYLTFKFLCLGSALFFLPSFFFQFHLLFVLFTRSCAPLPSPPSPHTHSIPQPCLLYLSILFFLSHKGAYSEVTPFTGFYEPWWGWGGRKLKLIILSSPRGHCVSARLGLVKVAGHSLSPQMDSLCALTWSRWETSRVRWTPGSPGEAKGDVREMGGPCSIPERGG